MQNINNYFKYIALCQNVLNRRIDPFWIDSCYDWQRAFLDEASEFYNQIGYKWWKKQERNDEQAKLELIDMLHFLISSIINKFGVEEADKLIEKADFNYEPLVLPEILVDHSVEYYYKEDYEGSLRSLYLAMKQMNMSDEDILFSYVGKNVLNVFRQNNGYKTGSYIKIWNGEEDNVILERLINTYKDDLIADTLDVFDILYNKLAEEYDKITK